MGALAEIGRYLIETIGTLYLGIVVLRFLLQLVKADFYNPISQFIAKATNPLLLPLRRVIPGIMGIDLASLILALLIQLLASEILALLMGFGLIGNALLLLVWGLIGLLSLTVTLYFWGLIVMIIASFIAPHSYHPALLLLRQLVEPVMAPFRRLLPPMGGLDFSPILAFVALNIISIVLNNLAGGVGLNPRVVLGI